MQAAYNDASSFPVLPDPFALVFGNAAEDRPPAGLETRLRHIGLRPEPVAGDDIPAVNIAGPLYRLRLASVSILVGLPSDEAFDLADPRNPSTSLLAASLPPEWRTTGQCWVFVPERDDIADPSPTRMREVFKMMALLIDLFGAGHIFWSPARLWSDAPQLRASIAEMLKSGMPPVLHLVAFRHGETGVGAVVRTRGLALFGGQEIEGRMPPGWTVAEMVKRLARLSLDIVLSGPVIEPRRVRGLEAGEWVLLSPRDGSDGHRTLLVEFGSDFG